MDVKDNNRMQLELSMQDIRRIVDPISMIGNFSGTVTAISCLHEAQPGSLSFLANLKYARNVPQSHASILLLPVDFPFTPKENQMALFCQDPSVALAEICHFIEQQNENQQPCLIHPSAIIHPSVTLGKELSIGPNVVVEAGTQIGDYVSIGAHSFIGKFSSIGNYSRLFPSVTVMSHSQIGKHVTIHPGAIIGSDGFGFAKVNGKYEKIPQIGNVILEDYTDIGANTTIDRARFASTIIGEGTKIDNLVQVAHNVKIGKHCIIVSQVGIAGSTTIGDYVTIGGQVGIAGHLHIADGTQICAQAGITKDTENNTVLLGSPAVPYKEAVKQLASIAKLPQMMKNLNRFTKNLQ